jgi:hypothetical protein
MLYRVVPVRTGFAVVLDGAGGVSRIIAMREEHEDAKRMCGDLNRFAALFASIDAIAHGKA